MRGRVTRSKSMVEGHSHHVCQCSMHISNHVGIYGLMTNQGQGTRVNKLVSLFQRFEKIRRSGHLRFGYLFFSNSPLSRYLCYGALYDKRITISLICTLLDIEVWLRISAFRNIRPHTLREKKKRRERRGPNRTVPHPDWLSQGTTTGRQTVFLSFSIERYSSFFSWLFLGGIERHFLVLGYFLPPPPSTTKRILRPVCPYCDSSVRE
ncbi:hypothetical protein QBC36DRAFT_89759 [Triangularia setosa]|uniref:Uncharacterized protein n=1 Tax=Triangularia setosa TaxID=2587417 RepID=A0AAN6WD83_9PEZI|nr:hypothetical protein QBC36DRAFT_89759 [Podospora setosa]